MREIEDRALESLLKRTLAERAEEIPFSLTPDMVRARLADRRRRSRGVIPGRRIVMLGLAAVLLLPIAAFIGGSLLRDRMNGPSPTVPALTPPSTEPSTPPLSEATSAPVADRYQALVVRYTADAAVIVAVRGDRQERVIASLPIVERRFGNLIPSADGWLARVNGAASEFIDLRDSGREHRPFSVGETTTGFMWSPDGRFAFWDESGGLTLIDPETGAETHLTVRGPLNDVVAWSADGSALLAPVDGGDSIYAGGERVTDPAWRVVRLDGGPDETTVPDLDLGLVRSARYGQRGARLQLCERGRGQSTGGEPEHYDCPDELMGGVVGDIPGGPVTTWYGNELAPDQVDDASFGGDGIAMWLLLDRRVGGRQFALARIDTPGTERVVAAAGLHTAGYDPFSIVAVAPDDSLVAIRASDLVLVEPITGRSTAIDGGFLAFISSATADTWAGEQFRPVEPIASLEPVLPAYPPLAPLAELGGNQLSPGDRELWHQEFVAVEGAAGAPTTTEIGPLEFGTGFGLVLVCSGPSDVRVTMEPDSPFMPALGRCDSGESVGGQIPSFPINASATFVVTANTDTSWQLVIFDPAPE